MLYLIDIIMVIIIENRTPNTSDKLCRTVNFCHSRSYEMNLAVTIKEK